MDEIATHRTMYLEVAGRLTEVVTTAGWRTEVDVR